VNQFLLSLLLTIALDQIARSRFVDFCIGFWFRVDQLYWKVVVIILGALVFGQN
jgi:hypothetical protein